ncbi:hypothetical protein NLI96_g10541 [Meripilus lineatus]|uniref:Uncharacterized protein n=1 Tax=Meripilus lineatus TaxID=2056292 RepID=A0AAD5YE82_9APHY|nr:hypothetical protein NLI96_g10541 [Physisporinus lineatus]
MSFARAGRLALPRRGPRWVLNRRGLATHGAEEHAAESTNVAFPKEDFSSPVWRNFILFGLAVVGFYKFAPSPDESNYVTRLLEHNAVPREVWSKLNLQHLLLSAEGQQNTLTIADAQRKPIHRYRYPQSFEQHFPHCQRVGATSDTSNVSVKGDWE